MLSDVCADFRQAVDDGLAIKDAAEQLLGELESCAARYTWYPPQRIETLQKAINAVLAAPGDTGLAKKLIAVAETTREWADDNE